MSRDANKKHKSGKKKKPRNLDDVVKKDEKSGADEVNNSSDEKDTTSHDDKSGEKDIFDQITMMDFSLKDSEEVEPTMFLDPEDYHAAKGTTKFVSPEEHQAARGTTKFTESTEDKGTMKFVDPSDMIKKKLMQFDTKEADEKTQPLDTQQLKPEWFLAPDELAGTVELGEKKPEEIEALEKELKEKEEKEEEIDFEPVHIQAVTPSSLEEKEEEAVSPDDDMDLYAPDFTMPMDLISPDEFEAEASQFVSKALKIGTTVQGKYKILKVMVEKKDHNSYLVKDIMVDGRKYILHEIIPPQMENEELRKRRYKFGDNVRLLMTFKHKYLGTVYEYFTENHREYYVMEYIEGLSFRKLSQMNVKAFSEKEARKWGADLCDVLTFLHDRPTPFTLGDFDPDDIMIDQNGDIKITSYNLQRFFDTDRTLEFMPDNPKELYDEITRLSRFIYYLLTKEEYEEEELKEIEFPEELSTKMKKLLTMCCKTGQQSIGYIKKFEQKLEDTETPEEESGFYEILKKSRWRAGQGISVISKLSEAFMGQSKIVMALEVIFVIFLVILGFANKAQQKGFVRPPGVPLMYVAGGDSIITYQASDLKPIDSKDMGGIVSGITSTKVEFRESKDLRSTLVKTDALIAAMKSSNSLRVLDSKTHEFLTSVPVAKDPIKTVADPKNNTLYVVHKSISAISLINLKGMKLKKVLLTGRNPVDMVILEKPSVSEEEINRRLKKYGYDNNRYNRIILVYPFAGAGRTIAINDKDQKIGAGKNLKDSKKKSTVKKAPKKASQKTPKKETKKAVKNNAKADKNKTDKPVKDNETGKSVDPGKVKAGNEVDGEKPANEEKQPVKEGETDTEKPSEVEIKGEGVDDFINEIAPENVDGKTPEIEPSPIMPSPIVIEPSPTPTEKVPAIKQNRGKNWIKTPGTIIAVANEESKDIMILDSVKGTVLQRYLLEGTPSMIIQSLDKEKLYVLDKKAGEIIVIDLLTNRIVQEIPVRVGKKVSSMALDKKHNRIWLALEEEDSLAYYDVDTQKFSETIPIVGNAPEKLFMDNKNGALWISNERSKDLVKFDCEKLKVLETIEVHKDIHTIYIEEVNTVSSNEVKDKKAKTEVNEPEEKAKAETKSNN